jgi:hypothetical protein
MLPATVEEDRSPVVQVIERTEVRYDVREGELGEVTGWCFSGPLALECNCRATLILDGEPAIRHAGLWDLECGVCGERFRRTEAPREEFRYL